MSVWRRLTAYVRGQQRVLALQSFLGELVWLLKADLPLSSALALLRDTLSQPLARHMANEMWEGVQQGQCCAAVMRAQPTYFDAAWVPMIALAEQAGELLPGLEAWHAAITQHLRLQAQWRQAWSYPALLGLTWCMVMGALSVWVLPQLASLYAQMQTPMPALLEMWLGVGRYVGHESLLQGAGWLSAIVLAVVAVKTVWRRVGWRCSVYVPVLGAIWRGMRVCRQLHVLWVLSRAQVPWPEGVALLAAMENTQHGVWQRCYHAILTGVPFHQALKAHPDFDAAICACLTTAEHSGAWETILAHLHAQHMQQLQGRISTLKARLGPWLTWIGALVVGSMMVGLYQPLLGLGDAMWSSVGM